MSRVSSNLSIHIHDSKLIPSIQKFNDPAFFSFNLKANGSEVTYFFMDELQLSEFIESLKNLTIPTVAKKVNTDV